MRQVSPLYLKSARLLAVISFSALSWTVASAQDAAPGTSQAPASATTDASASSAQTGNASTLPDSSSSMPNAPMAQDGQTSSLNSPPPVPYPYTVQRTHSYWQTHGFDLAASATGRYQQVVTDQNPALTNPTEGVGLLVNVREHPVSWFGLELNYSFQPYSERYSSATTGAAVGRLRQDQHEATAGYVFHFKVPGIQPFVTLGGGALNFRPAKGSAQFENQWRGTYMYEVGFDFVSRSHPHFGVRVQEHGLFYKAPDYHVASLRSNGYIHQAMPSAGIFYRF